MGCPAVTDRGYANRRAASRVLVNIFDCQNYVAAGVTLKSVTLGNVTMSHRTRERPAECLASLPLNYDRSAARSTRELVHSLQMYCKLLFRLTFPDEAPSFDIAYKWFYKYIPGRTNVTDDLRVGRPSTATTEDYSGGRHMIETDKSVTYRQIGTSIGIDRMRTGKRNRHRRPDSPDPNPKSKRDDISINLLT
ncbi:hypothetical protein EVAR_28300_1 [Eumeta japonica]|uniref:Mos1 transposase HTH domain-containing protein n=1 Tax=Eumeta variegata TaxID=151549 RepID=A0A4C1V9L3_EUMVA|nr:hypothetical protein EVAR_28300_1 [Eumeta japonica]